MIELNRHIEHLLIKHDCVILPELGGFVAHVEDACIQEDGWIYPPYRMIGFNSQLVLNDGLMVQSIMQTYDIDYPTAMRMLEEEIDAQKKRMQKGDIWHIGSLGVLSMNSEGVFEFEPYTDKGMVSPLLYGLDSVQCTPFSELKKTTPVAEVPVQQEELKVNTWQEEEDEDDMPSIWSRYGKPCMKYAAIFVGVMMLVLLTAIDVKDVKMAHINMPSMEAIGESIHLAYQNTKQSFKVQPVSENVDKVKEVDKVEEVDKVSKVKEVEEVDKVKEVEKTVAEAYYTIVLASQVKQKNAEAFIAQLKKDGFDKAELNLQNTNLRVIYDTYTTEHDAYNALARLKGQSDVFEEAWVMHVEP